MVIDSPISSHGSPVCGPGPCPEDRATARTYQIKLYCANCGIKEFYAMPYGSEFMPFEGPHESTSGQREYSYVHVGGLKEEPGTDHDRNCRNCGLPFLCLEYWDANESPTKKQKVAHNG